MSQDRISGTSSLAFPELIAPTKQPSAAESTTSFDEHLQRVADPSRATQPSAEPTRRESESAESDDERTAEQRTDSASQRDATDDSRTEESSADSVTVRDDKTVEETETRDQETEDVVEISGSEVEQLGVEQLIEVAVSPVQQTEQEPSETSEENEIGEESVGHGDEVNSPDVHLNKLNPTDLVPSGADEERSDVNEDIVKVKETLLPEGESLQSEVATDRTVSQVAEDVQSQPNLETEILPSEKQATTPEHAKTDGNTEVLVDEGESQTIEEVETAVYQTTDSSESTKRSEKVDPSTTSAEIAEEGVLPLPRQQEPTKPKPQSTEPHIVASKPSPGEQTAPTSEKQSPLTVDSVAATNVEIVESIKKVDVTTEEGTDKVDRVDTEKAFSRGQSEPAPHPADTPSSDNRSVVHRSLASVRANIARPQAEEAASNVRFVQRVAGAFRAAQDRGGEVQLRLSPPELGSLRIELTVKNGTLSARLEAETQAARTALLDNLPALRDRLAEQDIKVDRFDVDVREESSRQSHNRSDDDGDTAHRQSRESADSETDARSSAANHIPQAAGQAMIGVGDTQLNVVV